jgi:thioredoxin 1
MHLRGDKPLLVCVGAPWCGPCRKLKPLLKPIVNQYSHVQFLYIDNDQLPEIVDSLNVNGLPTTFVIYKKRQIGSVRGCDLHGINKLLDKLKSEMVKVDSEF